MHDGIFYSMFEQTRRMYKESLGTSPVKHDLVGWNSFQQTRPLYIEPQPLPPPPPPPTLTWPRKIYVATRTMGVYYTDNFSDPSTQPIWIRVNDGLSALNCWEFHLDPFEPELRQYVLIESGAVLYRRVGGGAWQVISDNAIRAALGCYLDSSVIGGFCLDPSVQGRIWLTTSEISHGEGWDLWNSGEFAFKSDDYGDTWTAHLIVRKPYAGTGTIRAKGDWVWTSDDSGVGVYAKMIWSANRGINWGRQTVDLLGLPTVEQNPLRDYAYFGTPQWSHWTGMFQTVANYMWLNYSVCIDKPGSIWFDPDDVNHQRIVYNDRLYVTNDEWTNHTDSGVIAVVGEPGIGLGEIISPWCGDNTDRMFVSANGSHMICALYGEGDLTADGIGGVNCNNAPYINSIPRLVASGGVCWCGIQPVREAGYVYT